MTFTIDSFSSSLMLGTTCYRNQPGVCKKSFAQGVYPIITVVAAIETVAALIFCTLSLPLYPCSSSPLKESVIWLKSSSFTILWSFTDFFLNPFLHVLAANESQARALASSRDIYALLGRVKSEV